MHDDRYAWRYSRFDLSQEKGCTICGYKVLPDCEKYIAAIAKLKRDLEELVATSYTDLQLLPNFPRLDAEPRSDEWDAWTCYFSSTPKNRVKCMKHIHKMWMCNKDFTRRYVSISSF